MNKRAAAFRAQALSSLAAEIKSQLRPLTRTVGCQCVTHLAARTVRMADGTSCGGGYFPGYAHSAWPSAEAAEGHACYARVAHTLVRRAEEMAVANIPLGWGRADMADLKSDAASLLKEAEMYARMASRGL